MMLARLGSLNALEQDKGNSFWKKRLGRNLPSADTIGRVFSQINVADIRSCLHHVYSRLKRNKAVKKLHGFNVLIIDGHESSSSYLRCCNGCLERTIHAEKGDRTQYYHRNVVAMIPCKDFPILLDNEEQEKGKDEVAAASILMERIFKDYPRAFDVVVADGLYLRAPFFKLLLDHDKDIVAVLKDERRDLLEDARGLFKSEDAVVGVSGKTRREMWDIEGFTSWESLGKKVRVVRSVETKTVRRQSTGKEGTEISEWIWATTLSQEQASTEAVINLGHDRWLIENKGMNEMVTFWHANHVYKHHPNAICAFWLTLMLVLNLFRAFVHLNIKAELRCKHTDLYFSRLIFAGLYNEIFQEVPP